MLLTKKKLKKINPNTFHVRTGLRSGNEVPKCTACRNYCNELNIDDDYLYTKCVLDCELANF